MKRRNPPTLMAAASVLLTALSCDRPNPTALPDGIQPSLATVEAAEANGGYEAIDLGTLGGASSRAWDINPQRQVVGFSTTSGGDTHAFLWEDGGMTDLGTLGGDYSAAWGINSQGQVVGESSTSGGELHAFLWENELMTDLGTFGGDCWATHINARGQVVGASYPEDGGYHAFLWQDGVMTDLGALPGDLSQPHRINARGQVVGISLLTRDPVFTLHAFLWEDGVMTDLGTLGGDFSWATDINPQGQVVGTSTTSGGDRRAFLWEDGVMIDLGGWSAQSINARGQVAGSSGGHAALWEDGVMTDLGTLGGGYSWAAAINPEGDVAGDSYTASGQLLATLWTKKPIRE